MASASFVPYVARRCAKRVGALFSAQSRGAVAADPSARHRDAPDDGVAFRCNLCGHCNMAPLSQLSRELPSCAGCGSTVRFRAIARLVTREICGGDIALPDLFVDREVTGLGLSDADAYAAPLARAFEYENTYYHAEPRLDIADIPDQRRGRYDFVIASDVFEHVAPPVSRAFANAHALLKPRGVFIFTVPFSLDADTVEHFPDLYDWALSMRDGHWKLDNTTVDGRVQTFDNPVFHGGPGTTLEMRLFSLAALERHFAEAGFARVRIAVEACAAFGIVWPEPWSVPIVAYAGDAPNPRGGSRTGVTS